MTKPAILRPAVTGSSSSSGFNMFRVLRFSAATNLTAPHTPRVPRVTLDRTVLPAAAVAFASGEIDRAELMRRITRR